MPDFIVLKGQHVVACESIPVQTHAFFELLYVCHGDAELTVEDKRYGMKAHMLAFLGAQERHALRAVGGGLELYSITFSPRRLDHRIGNPQLTSIFKNRPSKFVHCCEALPSTEGLLRSILGEYELRDSLSEDMIACYLHELLTLHYRQQPAMFPMPDSSIKPRVHQVKEYLDKNFASDVKVAELADIFYVNKYYLSHVFHALTGYSPKQYLRLARLTHAKKLLTTTTLPIKQIAIDSGFPDATSFIRTFKNEFGVTPNQSRGRG